MFDKLSFQWRITLLVISVTLVSLIAASVGFLTMEVVRIRGDVAERLEKTQQIYVERISRILVRNPATTDLPLEDLVQEPTVLAAAVYSMENRILDRYIRAEEAEFIPPPFKLSLSPNYVTRFSYLFDGEERVGIIYMKAEIKGWAEEGLIEPLRGVGMIALLSILVGMIASRILQRSITRPISELARTSKRIAVIRCAPRDRGTERSVR